MLEKLKSKMDAATKGPWAYGSYGRDNKAAVALMSGDGGEGVTGDQTDTDFIADEAVATEICGLPNAAAIAAARNAVPKLIDMLEMCEKALALGPMMEADPSIDMDLPQMWRTWVDRANTELANLRRTVAEIEVE